MRRFSALRVQIPTVLLVFVSACGVAPSSPGSPSGARSDASQAPKVLTWAIQDEPKDLTALSGLGGTRGPTSAFRVIAQRLDTRIGRIADVFMTEHAGIDARNTGARAAFDTCDRSV